MEPRARKNGKTRKTNEFNNQMAAAMTIMRSGVNIRIKKCAGKREYIPRIVIKDKRSTRWTLEQL